MIKGKGWHKDTPGHREAALKGSHEAQIRESLKNTLRQSMLPTTPECKSCGSCCTAHPCGIAPNEVYPTAKHLGISVKELFDTYLTGDYWVGDSDDYIYVAPRRVGDRSGRFDKVDSHWNMPYPPRACIFLTETNLCRIHPVKPRTARETHCKLPQKPYKLKLSMDWEPYIKPEPEHDDEWLDYADRIDYDKLERDFGEPKKEHITTQIQTSPSYMESRVNHVEK